MVDRRRRLYIIHYTGTFMVDTRMHMCVWCLRISYVCHVCIKPFVYMSGNLCLQSTAVLLYFLKPPTRHGRCCCWTNIKNTRLKPQSQLRFGQNGFTNQIKIMQCLLKVAAAARRPRQCFFVKEWLWRWWWRGWSRQWWWWQ